jgi:beta-lactamase superfamily II metal-dependent hydrolase
VRKLCYLLLLLSLNLCDITAQILTIHHIDVGQGDATLIRHSNGKTVLIDAGNTAKGKNVVLPYLQSLGVTSLDYLIASHYHADHIGGLDEVIEGLSPDSIRSVFDRGGNPPLPTTKAFSDYWSTGENTNRHYQIALGQTVELSDSVTLRCLAVDGVVLNFGEVQNSRKDENNLSLAWLLSLKQSIDGKTYTFRYFTGGDCGGVTGTYADLETPLATIAGDVDALKINHHGSRYSTNQTFLDSLRPEAVVISVGDRNTYGHPTQETLDRLQNAESVRFIYQTESGNGGTVLELARRASSFGGVKVLGTVTISVYDSFFTVGIDTFQLAWESGSQDGKGITAINGGDRLSNSEFSASFENQTLTLQLSKDTFVSVEVYNLLGQLVQNLAEGLLSPGTHRIELSHFHLPTGVYFIRVKTPAELITRKALVIR